MSLFNSVVYDPKRFFSLCLAVFFGLPLAVVGLRAFDSHALTLSSTRDCDDNAVINCGALNFTELQNRYSNEGVASIYSSFGISSNDISNINSTAVPGVVTRNNNVWIERSSGLCPSSKPTSQLEQNNPNLCLVGTDATTAGRQNISGSTAVTSGGVTFYKRPPSVSFKSDSLPAFVVMSNGRFNFAIIASCGNPVTATPVVKASQPSAPSTPPKTSPPPATPTSTPPQPSINITNNNTNTQSQSQSQAQGGSGGGTVQAPASAAQATTQQTSSSSQASAPASSSALVVGKTLPNTGPAGVMGITGLTTIFASVGHLVYSRRKKIV